MSEQPAVRLQARARHSLLVNSQVVRGLRADVVALTFERSLLSL